MGAVVKVIEQTQYEVQWFAPMSGTWFTSRWAATHDDAVRSLRFQERLGYRARIIDHEAVDGLV